MSAQPHPAQLRNKKSHSRLRSSALLCALGAATAFTLAAPGLTAGSAEFGRLDPAEIDRAVATFTGASAGQIGGARAPADPRLRLASCATPLVTSWHGTRQSAVKVECQQTRSGEKPWRIFVATLPADQSAPGPTLSPPQPPAAPVIKRGDPITVVVRGRGFTVQQTGEAMESGHIGDWISVRTARQSDPVRARIDRPGLAVIPID